MEVLRRIGGLILPYDSIQKLFYNKEPIPPQKRTLKPDHKYSNFSTFIVFLNACLGLSGFNIPYAIHEAGYVTASVIGIPIVALEHYMMATLIKIKFDVEDEVKRLQTYESAAYFCILAGPYFFRRFARTLRFFLKTMLMGYPLGLGTLNVAYVSNILSRQYPIHGDFDTNKRIYATLFLIPVIGLNCIKNATVIIWVTHVSAVLSLTSYGLTLLQIGLDRVMHVEYLKYNTFSGIASMMTSALIYYESVTTVLASAEEMIDPDNLRKTFNVLFLANLIGHPIYFFLGLGGYFRYGTKTGPNIIGNLRRSVLTQVIRHFICIYSICTYPTLFAPFFNVAWYHGIEQFKRINDSRYLLLYEYLFRIATSFVTVCLAVLMPDFHAILDLVGSICLSNLIFFFPALMHFSYQYERKNKWAFLIRCTDIAVMIFAVAVMLITFPAAIYNRLLIKHHVIF